MRANFQLSSLARPVYLSLALLAYGNAYAADLLVKTPEAYDQALKKAKPGDDIILANGTWRDFEVLFEAKGNENKPITLRGQTPGKVFLTGQSKLRLAGEH
ncbi:MAG: chondroitinase-B domain-containing protein, partial [Paraglaciecola chathamensis]